MEGHFWADKGLELKERELNDFHHLNRSCVQRKQKQGLSVPKKIKVKGSKSDYLVDAVSLYCPINKGLTSDEIGLHFHPTTVSSKSITLLCPRRLPVTLC